MKTSGTTKIKIKICGLTNPEQALSCAELGADLIGLNCWSGSSRFINPEKVREIVNALPDSVTTVGVFVNKSPEAVNNLMRETGMDLAQLHGDESVNQCNELEVPWFKAFRVSADFNVEQILQYGQDTFLLDAFSKHHYGGSGRKIDLEIAGQAAGLGRLILAGGLTAENVAEAAENVKPWGGDVCSGVESDPGIKDMRLVEKFISNIRKTDFSCIKNLL